MKIIESKDYSHQQLRSQKTGELYSLSDVISEKMGAKQLFLHHDIIKANTRASAPHRHSAIEEVVYILKGTVTVATGEVSRIVQAGDFILFDPNVNNFHFIFNHSDEDAETLGFSILSEFDLVIYDENQSDIQIPKFTFNQDLCEVPCDIKEWETFLAELKNELKAEKHPEKILQLYEHIGMASRILHRLTEAEHSFMKAVTLCCSHPSQARLVQNLIRLAHVYQWKKDFEKSQLLFNQVRSIINERSISKALQATYHQHLGKLHFDQGHYGQAQAEFALALSLRNETGAPKDQIESSAQSLKEALQRLTKN